nr:hypothetical protein [Enterococcus faecium]UHK30108.1 hypothetical protein KNN24_00195 [Enterococcus faecium]UHK30109.1 hypothetical protein KNN24_00215 [Enterococcus faecium]
MSVFELPTVTLIPNGIHHPPIEDGRLLPNSVKDVEALSESLTNALNLVKKAKLLFEFQTDYHNELLAQSEILD